jgi:hypothetical protein
MGEGASVITREGAYEPAKTKTQVRTTTRLPMDGQRDSLRQP